MSEIGEVSWNPILEKYFADSGERAHCLSWIHKRSEEIYSKRRTFIDLPVIIGSGVIAFLNAGSSSMFEGQSQLASIALGVGSLTVGILNTLGSYFGWAKRAEGHRISSIQYGRLYRFLSIEMSLPREERMNPSDLLKYTKDNYDRLQETSPLIPPEVIHEFKSKFSKYADIAKPEEANGLEKITVYPETMRQLTIRIPSHQDLDALVEGETLKTPVGFAPRPKERQPVPKTEVKQSKPLPPIAEEVESVLLPVAPSSAEPKIGHP
jgi:hypothetical protein